MDLAEQSGFTNREDYKSNWITTNQIKCWFLVRRENREYTGKKPKRTEQRTNKPNPHMTAGQEIKPAPLWWNFSHRFPDPALQKTGNNEPESYSGSESTLSTTANPSIPEIRRGREVVSLLHRLRSPAVSELSRIRKLSVNVRRSSKH